MHPLSTLWLLWLLSQPATLRMAILDLATKSLTRLGLELPLVGTEVPRFAVSPVLTVTRSDYVFLMMDNVIRVLSLATGTPPPSTFRAPQLLCCLGGVCQPPVGVTVCV